MMSEPRGRAIRWWVLAFSLPMQPAYARVKIWRLLQTTGAIALAKNALYVLPARRRLLADFEAVVKEACAVEGDAVIFEARLIAGYENEEVRALFQRQCDAEYRSLIDEIHAAARALEDPRGSPKIAEVRGQLARLVARARLIKSRDFFRAPTGTQVTSLLDSLARRLSSL